MNDCRVGNTNISYRMFYNAQLFILNNSHTSFYNDSECGMVSTRIPIIYLSLLFILNILLYTKYYFLLVFSVE